MFGFLGKVPIPLEIARISLMLRGEKLTNKYPCFLLFSLNSPAQVWNERGNRGRIYRKGLVRHIQLVK